MEFSRCQRPKNFTYHFLQKNTNHLHCRAYNVYISPQAMDPKTFSSERPPAFSTSKRRTGNCLTLAVGLLWNTGKVVGRSHKNTKHCVVMYYYFCVIFVALVLLPSISIAHYHENPSDNAPYMSRFSQVPGVMVR